MEPFQRAPVVVILSLVVAAIVWRRDQVLACLRRFFAAEAHPANLAVFRVVFFAAVLLRVWDNDPVGRARAVGRLPSELMEAPQVMGWVLPRLPLDDTAITLAGVALVGGALAALLGVAARLSSLLCALSMAYLMAAPNYFWKVSHDHQHLVWLALILAAAPAADALSFRRARQVVSARRRHTAPMGLAPDRRYALPLRMTWLVLGSIYLFAGIGKLQVGWDWFAAENVRNFLWLHWDIADWVPSVRVDRWNGAMAAAGVATVVVELGFLPAMFLRRARPVFAVLGTVFHLTVRWLLRIPHFWTLQVAYVTFVDWHGLAARLRSRPVRPGAGVREGEPIGLVAGASAIVVAAVFLAGAFGLERGWPFARYPTFGYLPEPATSELVFEVRFSDGGVEELRATPLARTLGPARYQLLALRAMALADADERDRRLRAIWEVARTGRSLDEVDAVNVYRVGHSTNPDSRKPPRRVRLATFRTETGLEQVDGG